jgi:hypothetical protein
MRIDRKSWNSLHRKYTEDLVTDERVGTKTKELRKIKHDSIVSVLLGYGYHVEKQRSGRRASWRELSSVLGPFIGKKLERLWLSGNVH